MMANARSHRLARVSALALTLLTLAGCASWRGVANVPLPGGPGAGPRHLTIFVQMPNTLALTVNSRVRVADVFVGTVRKIELENWMAKLTLDVEPRVKLPRNATAKIGQTSILGSQHVELAAPPDPSSMPLVSGDTISLRHATSFPTTERTLASIATVLRGGGIGNLETIQNEVSNIVTGRADQIRQFLDRLRTLTIELNGQRDAITRTIDATNRLLSTAAANIDVVDDVLTEFPPLIQHFADERDLIGDAVIAVGRLSKVAGETLAASRNDLQNNLRQLQRPFTQLGRAAPFIVDALRVLLTLPFNIDDVPKVVRGDYLNISGTLDLTLSALDNGLLTGTGFSGALRALEQSWGRDPATMIPDVRYAANPNDLPPERGE